MDNKANNISKFKDRETKIRELRQQLSFLSDDDFNKIILSDDFIEMPIEMHNAYRISAYEYISLAN